MGINCNIYLPADTEVKKVFDVIQKVMGAEFVKETFKKNQPARYKGPDVFIEFDGLLNASNDNPWHLNISKDYAQTNKIEYKDTSYLSLMFRDFIDQDFYCLYFTEYDCKELVEPGGKMLNPSHGAIWCVLGKRLVDFFGGKMLYSDERDEDDQANWYIKTEGKFSRKNWNEGNNELNNKWYNYQNVLSNEPRISSQELMDMKEHAYWYERDEKLYSSLRKLEQLESLENTLIKDESKKRSSLKI